MMYKKHKVKNKSHIVVIELNGKFSVHKKIDDGKTLIQITDFYDTIEEALCPFKQI